MILESQYYLEDHSLDIPRSIFSFPKLEHNTKVVLNYWREHCFECAPPICYQSCNNYLERNDGKCRLLRNGISPVKINGELHHRVRFRKWAKIESYGGKYTVQFRNYKRIKGFNSRVDKTSKVLATTIFGSLPLRGVSYGVDKMLTRINVGKCESGAFYFEFYSSSSTTYNFIFEQRQLRKSFKVFHGWNRFIVPLENIYGAIRFFPENDFPADIVIKHSFIYKPIVKKRFKNLPKLVVWDLDNTLWNGILIEDGIEPRDSIIQTIRFLDSMGIVNSLASKNDHQNAWSELEKLGLTEYFVYPKINWNPKSENIQTTLKQINLLEQNVIFVDDNAFERAEVGAAFPDMMVVDQNAFPELLTDIQLLDMKVDSTAQNRRQLYKQEEKRYVEFQSNGDNYIDFLRNCQISLTVHYDVKNWSQEVLDRCENLMSRTNQLNLSGSKMSNLEFIELLSDNDITKCYFEVKDKYGSYGIVGFLTISHLNSENILTNLVISCRVAKKGIEHKLIHTLFERFSLKELKAKFKKTTKNTPILEEMSLMGWKQIDAEFLVIKKEQLKPDQGIIQIENDK